MDEFDELIGFVHKSVDRDPWVREKKLEGFCHEIKNEAEEVLEAISNKDNENLKEELGDILYDWAHACILAEEKGLFTMKDVMKRATEKLTFRKPYILEKDKRPLTSEETVKIWFEAKAIEKAKAHSIKHK